MSGVGDYSIEPSAGELGDDWSDSCGVEHTSGSVPESWPGYVRGDYGYELGPDTAVSYSYGGASYAYSESVGAAPYCSVNSSGDGAYEIAYASIVVGCSYDAYEVYDRGATVADLL